ncbi:ECs_2282 family putative zinc-binding protein [Photorhabdus khanii]|uniref:ECs_2282 family putative zinc-binding protein n=1 Tax=Photorhabdus khanii TaxID=1004150 RepID=UPI003BB5CBAE
MSKINYSCPHCGNHLVVRSQIKLKKISDIDGTICSKCGKSISKDDIVKQSKDYAKKLVSDAFKKAGFKSK